MTRAVHDRILKDVNGDNGDHLRNHIHLTNCIHLKNHMHKHSPILAHDRTLTRGLVVLQRSRSLRDPPTSPPPSWQSPGDVDLLSKRGEKDVIVGNVRRPALSRLPRAKVAPDDLRCNDKAVPLSNQSKNCGAWHHRRTKREVSGGNLGTDHMHGIVKPPQQGYFESKEQKRVHREEFPLKTPSQQLNEVQIDCYALTSSHITLHGKHTQNEITGEARVHGNSSGMKRVKRRNFRGARRSRAAIVSRDLATQNEMSVDSNSLDQHSSFPVYDMGDEFNEQNFKRAPRNGCGIPWNWSRIHHGGRTFLDIAGRSFSCGLSDSRLNRGVPIHRGRDVSEIPVMSERSSSFIKSEAEALPLLNEASGSKRSTGGAAWVHDYSGELGIFADNLLKHECDSDLASEAFQNKLKRHYNGRHRNLTQKYMPRTFRDLVGQNLVAQALLTAIVKRKIGLLYVFYGPHGTGKTSCARIFARALNCESVEDPKPCGVCSSCIACDMGKSQNIKEVRQVSNFDLEGIMVLLDKMILSHLSSQYKVLIFDDCDTLSSGCWSAISKVIDQAPRRLVFVLVSSSLDVLPHVILSRCQKFVFPKLKEADILYTLQWIATKEELEIDTGALKLIASRSEGSLRDAEMTLEQLSLLGQRISVPLVQELVGLISDEKLVDLLDLALSADTVNTVKYLREIMESGIEPLALMSQLATVITDILAGSCDLTKERTRRKFFRQQALSKEDMEKLRQALRTLSEAEKQLRLSNDRLTWLTAAILQLAPDQQYMLPGSSADTSYNHSPLILNNGKERPSKSNFEPAHMLNTNSRIRNSQARCSSDNYYSSKVKGSCTDRERDAGMGMVPQQTFKAPIDSNKLMGDAMHRISGRPSSSRVYVKIEEIWSQVLEKMPINNIKEFLYREGKLVSVTFGADPAVRLMFSSNLTKSTAEKYRSIISQAFVSVLGYPVTIEIRCESMGGAVTGCSVPLLLPASQDASSQIDTNQALMNTRRIPAAASEELRNRVRKDRSCLTLPQILYSDSRRNGKSEVDETVGSPREVKGNVSTSNNMEYNKNDLESESKYGSTSLQKKGTETRKSGEQNPNRSLVRTKLSLAHLIQQVEGCNLRNGWSKRRAVTIAEKLEQENLRLEPKSRSLLCWKAPRLTRRKLSGRVKVGRRRKSQTLLKMMSCSKCLSAKY